MRVFMYTPVGSHQRPPWLRRGFYYTAIGHVVTWYERPRVIQPPRTGGV